MKTEIGNKSRRRWKRICSVSIARFLTFGLVISAASSGNALTVEEILSLKKAGVSEETLQMLLEREREEKIMAQRAGTWKVGDGRTVYTTEAAPSASTEYRQEVYPLCIFPQVEVPRRPKK